VPKEESTIIKIDTDKSTPIYRQIIESVQQGIESGKLKLGDLIPSVNATASRFSIARGSIFKAYDELRTAGVIDSIPGKGYFVINTSKSKKKNIFLLLSTYNPYREVFYNAFIDKLKNQASVEIYFHHHNIGVFETLVLNHASHYNTFVIMPEIHKRTAKILSKLNQQQLFVLETGLSEFGTRYAGVYQDYRKDIYSFLASITKRLADYQRVLLLFSSNMRNYQTIKGFEDFFEDHPQFEAKVIQETQNFEPSRGDLCLVLDDNDLVQLVLYSKEHNWKLGDDLGVISYNETPLKRVIADGISTISPDFEQMGKNMADLVLQKQHDHIVNSFLFIDRGSF